MKINLFALVLFMFYSVLNAQQNQIVEVAIERLNEFTSLRDFSISKDNTEAYFTIQSPGGEISQIGYIKNVNNNWTEPQLLSCNDQFNYLEPFLSNDQKRLFFVSDRPLDKNDVHKKDFDIWYVERQNKNEPWSSPINLGSPVNSGLNEFYPTLSGNGNLYFTLDSPNGLGKDDIYFSKWDGLNYLKPEMLNKNINSEGYEFNAFVSQNEDFLIYTKYNSSDGFGSGDLYIARRDQEEQWQPAKNLGVSINTKYMEYCPFYDEANQMLYFTSKRNTIVSKKFNNLTEFQEYILQSHNGLSKVYKVKIVLE